MEVILTKDVEKVGKCGAVVKVKDGFARNFLMPRGLAIEVSAANLKKVEQARAKQSQELEQKKGAAEALKSRLNSLSLTISALTQEDESLYGGIGAADICSALKEEGIELNKECVLLEDPIKALGIYEVALKLHPQVESKLKVWIVKK
jgi:large subunit ribosomal protein L9